MIRTYVFCALVLAGCKSAPAAPLPARFDLAFSVRTDDGEPLAGVTVRGPAFAFGTTDGAGRVRTSVEGAEGQAVPVTFGCPAGFAPPERPEAIRLARTRRVGADGQEPVRYEALCTRKVRDVVVVIHAESGHGLPIHVNGTTAGMTDSDGNAHVLVRAPTDAQKLVVALDTSGRPELRPQHPSRTFDLAGRDAVLVADSAFAVEQKRVPRRRTGPVRHVPYRID